jgi:succinate dehydrogenase / fumarate reductase, cytochrome b subunit
MLHRVKSLSKPSGELDAMAHSKTATEGARARPLSPHLQIYTPLINMVASILHRITGAALYFGTILLAWWLIAAATSPAYFEFVNGLFGTWFGRLVLFGYTWALMQHMLGGIRHLIWDTGRGFDLVTVDRMAWGSIIGSVILTGAIWVAALSLRGAV